MVAINVFPNDTADELALVDAATRARGVRAVRCEGFARGGEGALELGEAVAEAADATDGAPPPAKYVYELEDPLREKVRKIARVVYGAKDVSFTATADKDIKRIEDLGAGALPVCMAKTQLSLSDHPSLAGRPRDFVITGARGAPLRGRRLRRPTGDMMTMPGLPREPAALRVKPPPGWPHPRADDNDD